MTGRDENEQLPSLPAKRNRIPARRTEATFTSFKPTGKRLQTLEGEGLALGEIPVLKQRVESEKYPETIDKLFQALCPGKDEKARSKRIHFILQHKGFKISNTADEDKLKMRIHPLLFKSKPEKAHIWELLAMPKDKAPDESHMIKFLMKPSMDLIDDKYLVSENKEQKQLAPQRRGMATRNNSEAIDSPRESNRRAKAATGVKARGKTSVPTDSAAEEVKTEAVEAIVAPSLYPEGSTISTRSKGSDKSQQQKSQAATKDIDSKKRRQNQRSLDSDDKEQQGAQVARDGGRPRKAPVSVAAADHDGTGAESGEARESGDAGAAAGAKMPHDSEASTVVTPRGTRNAARGGARPERSRGTSALGVSQDAGVKKPTKTTKRVTRGGKSTELDEDAQQSHDHEMKEQPTDPIVPAQPPGPPGLGPPPSIIAASKDAPIHAAQESAVPVVGAPDAAPGPVADPVLPPNLTSPLASAVTDGAHRAGVPKKEPMHSGPVTLPVSVSDKPDPGPQEPVQPQPPGVHASTRHSQPPTPPPPGALLPPGVPVGVPGVHALAPYPRASTSLTHGTSKGGTTNSSAPSRGPTEPTTSDEERDEPPPGEDDTPPGIEPPFVQPSNKKRRVAEHADPPPVSGPVVDPVPSEGVRAVHQAAGQAQAVAGSAQPEAEAPVAAGAAAVAGAGAAKQPDERPTDANASMDDAAKTESVRKSAAVPPEAAPPRLQQQQQQYESDAAAAPMDTDDVPPVATEAAVQDSVMHDAAETAEPANTKPHVSQNTRQVPVATAAKPPPPPGLVSGATKAAAPAPKREATATEAAAVPSQENQGNAPHVAANAPSTKAKAAAAAVAAAGSTKDSGPAPDSEASEPHVDALIATVPYPATRRGSVKLPKLWPLLKVCTVKKRAADAPNSGAVEEELVRTILWKTPSPFDRKRREIRYSTVVAGCLLGQALKLSSIGSEAVGRNLLKVQKKHVYKLLNKKFRVTEAELEAYAEDIRVAFQVLMLQFPYARDVAKPTPAPKPERKTTERKGVPRRSSVRPEIEDSEEGSDDDAPMSSGDDDFEPGAELEMRGDDEIPAEDLKY